MDREKLKHKAQQEYYKLIGIAVRQEINKSHEFDIITSCLVNYSEIKINRVDFHVRPLLLVKNGKELNLANVIFNGDEKYFIHGDIPMSADGEYRYGMMNFSLMTAEKERTKLFRVAKQFYDKNKAHIISPVNVRKTLYIIMYTISGVYNYNSNIYPNNFRQDIHDLFMPYLKDFAAKDIPNAFTFHIKGFLTRGIGVKIIPLFLNDVKSAKDINNFNQKEIIINNHVRKLIINSICSHFAMILDWNLFKIDDLGIFGNKDIVRKYMQSKQYLESLIHLYAAGHVDGEEEYIETYKNKLRVPITYAEKHLIVSEYCIMLFIDYTGRTLADSLINIISESPEYKIMGNICTELNPFRSMIFQLAYSLLSLNKHYGIIHGDLHLNNITMRKTNLIYNGMYIIDGKKWIIELTSVYYIIDFGRSFVNPFKTGKLGADVSGNKKLLNYFAKVVPEFYVEYKKTLEQLFITHTEQMFNICMGLDLFYLIKMLRNNITKYLSMTILEFMHDVETTIYTWMHENIIHMSKNEKIDERFINQIIIEKFFETAKDSIDESNVIIYNKLDNDLKYDLFSKELPVRKFYKEAKTDRDYRQTNKILHDRMDIIAEGYSKEWTL